MYPNYGQAHTPMFPQSIPQLTHQFTFGELGSAKEEFDFWKSENFFNQPANLTESIVDNQQPISSDNWFTSINSPQTTPSQVTIVQQQYSPTFEQKTSDIQPIVRSVRRIRLSDRSISSPTNSQKGEYFTFSENRLQTNMLTSAVISTPNKALLAEESEEHIFLPGNTISSIKVSNFESRQELDFEGPLSKEVEERPLTSVRFPLFPNFTLMDNQKRVKASTILSALIDVKKSVSKYRNKLGSFLNLKNISETQREKSKLNTNQSMAHLTMIKKAQTGDFNSRETKSPKQEPETPAFVSKVLVESKLLLEKSTNIVDSVISSQRYEELMKRKGTRTKQENVPKVETSKLINAYLPSGFLTSMSKKSKDREMLISGRFL